MKTLPLLTAALLLFGTASFAQDAAHGAHFLQNWDLDGDGIVTLAEATEKRNDVFTAFDADEDGKLSSTEYDQFDEMRATDQAQMQEANGMGKGKGKGHGKGHGMFGNEEAGMQRGFNDANGDGFVSREEFMAVTPGWVTKMDRNKDGKISADDFGNM